MFSSPRQSAVKCPAAREINVIIKNDADDMPVCVGHVETIPRGGVGFRSALKTALKIFKFDVLPINFKLL